MGRKKNGLREMYALLEERFGDLCWWPAETPFEVMVGAVLTQNTNWKNVEKAIEGLKKNGLMTPEAITKKSASSIARIIKPSGYYKQKALRLKEISKFVLQGKGLKGLEKIRTGVLREKLLEVKGVGPETADSILLYAFEHPIFVVDTYTRRIFARHGLINPDSSYDQVQEYVYDNFPKNIKKFNQLHALIVETGKNYCRKKEGVCGECPLKGLPHTSK